LRPGGTFCHRCGNEISTAPRRGSWVFGARFAGRRYVARAGLRQGTMRRAIPWLEQEVLVGDLLEGFIEAARWTDASARFNLMRGKGKDYTLVIEGKSVILRFRVRYPYARVKVQGPLEQVRAIVQRFAARCGSGLFVPADDRWGKFEKYTGVDEAHNRATLAELLADPAL